MLRYISSHWLGLQREFYTVSLKQKNNKYSCERNKLDDQFDDSHLILIKFAVFVLLLAFVLEGDDNETDEDVHHEERDDDDVDDVVGGHNRPKVMNWSAILVIRVDRPL